MRTFLFPLTILIFSVSCSSYNKKDNADIRTPSSTTITRYKHTFECEDDRRNIYKLTQGEYMAQSNSDYPLYTAFLNGKESGSLEIAEKPFRGEGARYIFRFSKTIFVIPVLLDRNKDERVSKHEKSVFSPIDKNQENEMKCRITKTDAVRI